MVPNTASHPVPKNDLVFGEDFLSIYINQDKRHPSRNVKYRSKFLFDSDDRPDDIANKDIVPVPPSSVLADKRYTDNKYPQQQHNVFETDVSSDASKTNKNEVDPNKNIVKLVTTGSKIVFFEDDEDDDDALTMNGKVGKRFDHDVSASQMADDMTMPDEIKVVSVSVSSSRTRTKITEPEKQSLTASKSMKDELMVDEDEPATDSLNQESMRIHTIISPPSNLKPESIDGNQPAQMNPVQTVIIHDDGEYQREGSARPRSVSYSSVSQTIHRRQFENAPVNLTRKTGQSHLPQPKLPKIYSEPAKIYSEPAHSYSQASKVYGEPSKFYSEPSKVYSEPSKVYSEPEKVYSVPSKVYSEPSKVYSEPAKFYSEPSKVYSQPSKVYGEPSKFYSLPAGTIEQPQPVTIKPTIITTTTRATTTTNSPPTSHKKIIFNLDKLPYDLLNAPAGDNTNGYLHVNSHTGEKRFHPSSGTLHRQPYPAMHADQMDAHHPNADLVNSSMIDMIENRFQSTISLSKIPEPSVPESRTTTKLDESSSSSSVDSGNDDVDPKVGYVVEGRNFRKYRVEEKTSDGFIVGEYGVVSTNDGSLRGVRYTADSDINPNLIYKALMKFLSL